MVTTEVIKRVPARAVRNRSVSQLTQRLNNYLPVPEALHVPVVFIEDKEMKQLNTRYRNKLKTTDVLSFRYDETHGEVAISYPQTKRQAKQHGVAITKEIDKLVVHGLLHVLGFDHEEDHEAEIMEGHEQVILGEHGD